MIGDLYNQTLLRLAADATGAGRLDSPDVTFTLDNPLCGDRIIVDLAFDGGRIAAFAHDVKGCVLCQASAAVLGARAAGASPQSLAAVRAAIAAMLDAVGAVPAWPELSAFAPVAPQTSRHRCVLLPFDAVLQAAANANDSSS